MEPVLVFSHPERWFSSVGHLCVCLCNRVLFVSRYVIVEDQFFKEFKDVRYAPGHL